MLRCYIFLADSMRFEAARSSKLKSLFSALWIGPNSALGWRKSFRRVAKKKRKKSNNLARFYYMHAKYFLSTEYNHKGNFFADPKIIRLVLGKVVKSSSFFFEREGCQIFYRGGGNYNPQLLQCTFFGNLCMLHDRVCRFIQISDRGAW